MNPLSIYLWKEWREQRATFAVLAAVLLVGIAAVVAVLPARLASDPLVFQGAVAIALLAAIMSTGSDLLARERSGAGLGFLQRMPAGIARAFRAKLVLFALALACAAAYGALLATAAAWIRSGELPQRLLEGPAPWWIASLLGVSLWVFALSAWMPSSALTFPGTVLLLAALAWPAVLALQGDPLFRPTPYQGLVFALLSLAGAPISAWAAFVLGSRQGRSRRWASIAGLAVAALFFAPSWAWAAARYESLVNAPFEIAQAWAGPDGRFVFVDLRRRPPPGRARETSDGWQRYTALVVDLEQRAWRLAGERDASAFVSVSRSRDPSVELHAPLRLLDGTLGAEANEVLVDKQSARVLGPEDRRALSGSQIVPRDFGLERDPERWWIYPAGLGHRLNYWDGERTAELYRSIDGREVFDSQDLPKGENGRALCDVRVRRGRWIACDVGRWVLLDPSTCEVQRLEPLGNDEWVGPLLEDGRVVVANAGRAELLDPDNGERTALRLVGEPSFEVRSVGCGSGYSWSTLPADSPVVVRVASRERACLALLDVRASTLTLGPCSAGRRLELLWSQPPEALVIEDDERVARYDLAADVRSVLFSVDELD